MKIAVGNSRMDKKWKNQENARTYCRFAVEAGCVPIAPHIYFTQFMNDNDHKERDLALFMDIVLLSKGRRWRKA